MSEAINSKYCVFVILFSQITFFLTMSINSVALNPTEKPISEFINSTFEKRWNVSANVDEVRLIFTLAQSMLMVGSLLGAIGIRFMLQLLSRRSTMGMIHVIFLISSVLMSPVTRCLMSYESLIIGRLLNGFARGLGNTLVPLIVAETTNKKTLALFQAPLVAFLQIGAAIGNILGLPFVLGGPNTWPYFFAIPGFFSLLYLSVFPWIPDTPTSMIVKEVDQNQAMEDYSTPSFELLRKLRSGDLSAIRNEYDAKVSEISTELSSSRTTLCEILSGSNNYQFFGAIIIYCSFQCTGIQAIVLYTNLIFKEAGITEDQETFYTIGMFITMALVLLISIPFLSRFGSRKMMLSGLTLTMLALALLTLSLKTHKVIPNMSRVSIASLALYTLGTSSGPMLCFAGYSSEITSQLIRPTALWIGGIGFYVLASAVSFGMPYAIESIDGYVYLIFVGLLIFDIIYIKFFIPHNNLNASEPRPRGGASVSYETFDEATALLAGNGDLHSYQGTAANGFSADVL